MGYSPWGHEESDTHKGLNTAHTHTHTHIHTHKYIYVDREIKRETEFKKICGIFPHLQW